ncbi:MAG TPA: hypothetical protein VFG04_23760 [Planctomycetaceae bacterium]|jgi:hypothetical protein|nr:hypothetical protein [Planctomycetaceae bacterium]
MRWSIGRFGLRAVAAAIVGLSLAGAAPPSGPDDDLVDESAKKPVEEELVINANGNINIAASIDQLVYGNPAQNHSPQERLELRLQRRIELLARDATLSENQKQKLLFAGKGDIGRLVERVELFKTRYQTPKVGANGLDWNQLSKEVQPLAASRVNLFANESLFAKTLARVLTAEQLARHEKIERERAEFQHRTGVQLTVLRMSTALGLSDDQRRRLEQLLLKETRPGRSPNRLYPTACFNIVIVQMAHLPAERLKPLFEPWQWRALERKLKTAARFEEGLERNGVVLDGGKGPQFGRPAQRQ